MHESHATNRNRVVRSYSLYPHPRISKSIINVHTDDEIGLASETNCQENAETENQRRVVNEKGSVVFKTKWTQSNNCKSTLDCIIEKILKNHKTCDLMVVITPSSRHPNQYKLHLIDRNNEQHLGMISINQQELNSLGETKVLDKHAMVFGSQYIDLRSIVSKAKTINASLSKIMKEEDATSAFTTTTQSRSSNCFESTDRRYLASASSSLKSSQVEGTKTVANERIGNPAIRNPNQLPVLNNDSDLKGCRNNLMKNHEIRANRGSQTEAFLMFPSSLTSDTRCQLITGRVATIAEITSLIQRIQKSAKPSTEDISQLFDIAELCKFHLIIRPNLLSNNAAVHCENGKLYNQILFYLECYLSNKNYVGYINVDVETLYDNLDTHPNILENIRLAKDAFDVIPMPRFLVSSLYWICSFLGIQIFYDLIAETAYTWYKTFWSI